MARIADQIKAAQDTDGMIHRALERIIQLYTDKSHFIYELLQNAEDAKASVIKFIQYSDRLEVLHDGRPFTNTNLQGLCDIGKSDKVDQLNQIGEFGVGFKSVFGICETVKLYSEPSHYKRQVPKGAEPFAVEIMDFTRPEDISEEPMPSVFTTRFVFPYAVGNSFSGFKNVGILRRELSQKLQNLGVTTLLFMKNLTTIEYQIKTSFADIEGKYKLDKKKLSEHCFQVTAIDNSESRKDKIEKISYLVFKRRISSRSSQTVDIAFPVIQEEEKKIECVCASDPYVSVYFPTETESKLNFIVQGPYRTTPNRGSIPTNDPDNIKFAGETAILLEESLKELRDMNILNMSFLKVLPIDPDVFEHFPLFLPLYKTVKSLFSNYSIIPCRSGGYIRAKYAKIGRGERLSSVFNDRKLSELINDGHTYKWLSNKLTETNKEYRQVYAFFTGDLKIDVVRPENLRNYFSENPTFLPSQNEDWLVDFYSMLSNLPAIFTSGHEGNMLMSEIIKTSTGKFVAPYKKIENDGTPAWNANVFLPVKGTDISKIDFIEFVDENIFSKCRYFFEVILQLKAPDEYEFGLQDIKIRYGKNYQFNENQHIKDVKFLLSYLNYSPHANEVKEVVQQCFELRCSDGIMHKLGMRKIYSPKSGKWFGLDTDINIKSYFDHVNHDVFYVDLSFYEKYGVSISNLESLGVRTNILLNFDVTEGKYTDVSTGKYIPSWKTSGSFRWKFSLESIEDVLIYISKHPMTDDAVVKSKTIMSILLLTDGVLHGDVMIRGNTPDLKDTSCELVRILRRDKKTSTWNGKWLYTKARVLVSSFDISCDELDTSIYGKPRENSGVYQLLGFKKSKSEQVEQIKRQISKSQRDVLFEYELKERYGITSNYLNSHFSDEKTRKGRKNDFTEFEFPVARVKSWDSLRKHAAEALYYAAPVTYQNKVRSIRTSNNRNEVREYLMSMYKYEDAYMFACQLCHQSCDNFDAVEIFDFPKFELDPLNLCLCPNCVGAYRSFRHQNVLSDLLLHKILSVTEGEIEASDPVKISVQNVDLWFTQTHFAEIQVLLKLEKSVELNDQDIVQDNGIQDPHTVTPLSQDAVSDFEDVSIDPSQYVGKKIARKRDGFVGTIAAADQKYLIVSVEKGERVGEKIKLDFSIFLSHLGPGKVYEMI